MLDAQEQSLRSFEIQWLVDEWIGTDTDRSAGLAWFKHDELTDFFVDDCGLPELDGVASPDGMSKRDRLMDVLGWACVMHKIVILENLLLRAALEAPPGDSPDARQRIGGWISRLRQASAPLPIADGAVPEVAQRALRAARSHMEAENYLQAVDRVHTAIHACIRELAREVSVDVENKRGVQEQFAAVRSKHPAFIVNDGDQATAEVLRGLGRALDGINAMRNRHSLAHPSDQPLDQPEARLGASAGMTFLQYIVDRTEMYEQACAAEAELADDEDS